MFTKKFLATTIIFTTALSAMASPPSSSNSELEEDDLRSQNRSNNSRSYGGRSLKLTHKQIETENKENAQRPDDSACGQHWFHNGYATFDFGYTEFEDTAADNAGTIHYHGLTLGATIGTDTDISLTLSHDEEDQRGTTDYRARTYGATLTLNHHINEWLSAGAFGFYAETEFEGFKENNDTYGGGLFVSGYWTLAEGLDLSTTHSISTTYDDFSHDNLYVGSARVGYDWCDEFNSGVSLTYTDSLRDLRGFDSAYWTIGLDATYNINEQFSVGLSWETLQSRDHNHQTDTFLTVNWLF